MTFEERVAHNLEGVEAFSVGVSPTCETCLHNHDYVDSIGRFQRKKAQADWESGRFNDEGGFTWSDCPSCGMELGHQGYVGHGIIAGKIVHFDDICSDCLMYHANGEVPD